MVGLAATRLLGWWWLDSVAALALIPLLIKEGRAAHIRRRMLRMIFREGIEAAQRR